MSRAALVHITAVVLLGLTTAATGAQTAKPEQPAKPDQSVTTIVGCLVQGNPSATGSAANAQNYFVRTPAITVPAGTPVSVGGAGRGNQGTSGRATTSAGDPESSALYRITGLDREQLRPHVGHRVELQGHLTAPGPSENSTTAKTTVDATGRATTRVEPRMDVAGVLHATALKMIEASCS